MRHPSHVDPFAGFGRTGCGAAFGYLPIEAVARIGRHERGKVETVDDVPGRASISGHWCWAMNVGTAMLFTVYRRDDRRWLVLPALMDAPLALETEGDLACIGTAALDFNHLTTELALAIALHGYGLAHERDEVRLAAALARDGCLYGPAAA